MAANQLAGSTTLKIAPYSSKVTAIPGLVNYAAASTPLISAPILGCSMFDAFNILLNITTFPATTAELYVQGFAPDGVTVYDIYHMTQQTTVAKLFASFASPRGTVVEFVPGDAALTAGASNAKLINLPTKMQIKIAFTGTGNVQLAVDMEFFRRGTGK